MPPTNTYNLDIHMYNFEELLNLFNLSYDMDIHDMKRAKKQVLMTHPDKSKLDAKYFLFYKKAFDVIVKFYENQTKQNQTVSNDTKYNPGQQHYDKETSKNINKSINAMDKSKFNNTFNIGGDIKNAISLKQLTKKCEKLIGHTLNIKKIKKTSKFDIPYYVTDNKKINRVYKWKPLRNIDKVLKDVYMWLLENKKLKNYFN